MPPLLKPQAFDALELIQGTLKVIMQMEEVDFYETEVQAVYLADSDHLLLDQRCGYLLTR